MGDRPTRRVSLWVGVAFGALCLALFASDADWHAIGRALAGADPVRIVVATPTLLLTMVGRAWRWRTLLGVPGVRFRHRLTSTAMGFAGNNALPGRLGEPLRCLVISRLDRRVRFGRAAGSLVVERIFDLAAAVLCLVIFLVAMPIGSDQAARHAELFARLEWFGGLLSGVALAIGVVLYLAAGRRPAGRAGWQGKLVAAVGHVQDGFASVRSVRAVLTATLFTAVVWGAMLTYYFLMMRAFGFAELGMEHALGLMVVLSFAIALPQAPAGLGVVQLATQTTLAELYGVPLADAKAFAIGLWACQVSTVILSGVVAAWVEGMSAEDIRAVSRAAATDAADQARAQ